ncbi:MAG: amidase [Chloroflexi bacterium]|nr:MAG: amidase [Chloroflexota bacterium]TMF73325.1 MAG: amidase [Chloroflexota bacterium]TMF77541.1 MAG: amidase [Chloroflexota bacterium]TMF96591.1 MAG: amidase [Chloroflexota bacterium]TMG44377.1 MAG: amidase [Chloroflexota bacterium]
MDSMDLDQARARIRERSELNAFISVSDERGGGDVVAVKDLIDVKGMVTTAGAVILPNVPAADDAPVIKRLRRAGCAIVGKANLHEFAYGVTSINPHYGTVRNPHDPARVAGGSSGGSAVAVATGMCDWAIGSDTGGSIRIPASLCGVAGFKPAFGSIGIGGVIPLSKSLDTLGPMAPDIASTARAYSLLSGESISLDQLSRPRLAIPRGWVTGLDQPTAEAWAAVSGGIPEVELGDREPFFQAGLTILLFEAAAYHRRWADECPEKYGADVLGLIRRGFAITQADFEAAMRERARLQNAAERALDAIDALILPATAIVAPPEDTADEVREPLSRFTRPFNTTHQPVAVVPAPVSGLPVGIQVAGRTNAETLRAAAWLEREWKRRAG